MNLRTLVLTFLALVLIATPAMADGKATDLVTKADLKLRGKISSIQLNKFIVYRPGKRIERTMLVYLRGKKFSFTHITKPQKDKNTTILKRGHDMWMYTPKVRKTIRIPFAMMHEAVLGSDFTYDDLMKEATFSDDYSHKIVGTSKAMRTRYGKVYVIDLAPLPGRPVAYKKLRMWVREKGSIMLRLQYYDDNLKVERVMQFSDIKRLDDRVLPTKWDMFSLRKKGYHTVYQILNAKFESLSEDTMFTMRSLENPPEQALKGAAVAAHVVSTEAPNATKLVTAADIKLRGEVSSIQNNDFVVYRPGKKIERKMKVYLRGKRFSFTHVTFPMKDKDSTILKRDHDMWMYTPKVRKTIRIPFAMMHEGVLGSDFTYDDLMKEATFSDDYSHKIIGVSKAMARAHGRVYVIELFPLPGRPVAYKKLRMWVKEEGSIMLRIQYYDDNLKVDRVMQFSDIKEIGGRVIPTTWDMHSLRKKGHHTIYRITEAAFNTIKTDSMFVQRTLTSPPSK